MRILYKALVQLAGVVRREFSVDVTGCLTLSGVAMQYYRSACLQDTGASFPTQLPGLFRMMRDSAYVGGLVIAPGQGKVHRNAHAYDMTSMYPAMMAQYDIPGGRVYWDEAIDINDPRAFGWMRALARAPTGKRPCLLPLKWSKGNGPRYVGSHSLFYGLFFTEELRAAVLQGYQIETFGGLRFERVSGAFKGFVDKIHTKRRAQLASGDEVGATTTKLVMNGLYGRLAMKPREHGFAIPGFAGQKVESVSVAGLRLRLASTPLNTPQLDVSLPVSAAVTSYARIAMSRYINLPGNQLLYSDTDSVVFDRPLNKKHVRTIANPLPGTLKYEGYWKDLAIVGPK